MTTRGMDTFQRLAVATTVTTYLLILVGAVVRATGSGMGCPDWPRCFGNWVPPLSVKQLPAGFDPSQFNAAKTWTEYLNRLLGAVTGLLIFWTVIEAFRRYRHRGDVLWPAVLAFLAVGFEGWLGGRVVAHGLAPWIVTMHLLGALVVVGALLYAAIHAFLPAGNTTPRVSNAASRHRGLAMALLGITLAQIVLGTQVRSGLDTAQAAGADPVMLLQDAVGMDLMHRRLSIVVLALACLVAWRVGRDPASRSGAKWAAAIIPGLVLAQVVAGLAVAYLSIPPAARVAHVVLASLLVGAEMTLAILIGGRYAGRCGVMDTPE